MSAFEASLAQDRLTSAPFDPLPTPLSLQYKSTLFQFPGTETNSNKLSGASIDSQTAGPGTTGTVVEVLPGLSICPSLHILVSIPTSANYSFDFIEVLISASSRLKLHCFATQGEIFQRTWIGPA